MNGFARKKRMMWDIGATKRDLTERERRYRQQSITLTKASYRAHGDVRGKYCSLSCFSVGSSSVEILLNVVGNGGWLGGWAVALDDLARLVNEELCRTRVKTNGAERSENGSHNNEEQISLISDIPLTGKVPLDAVGAKQTRFLALEVLEDIVSVGAVDIGLGHDRERDCASRVQ